MCIRDRSYKPYQAHSVAVVSSIIKDVVRNALMSIEDPLLLEAVEREQRQNERETEQLLRDAEVSMRDHAVAGICESVLHEVVNEAIEDVYLETLEARQLIAGLLSSAIVGRVQALQKTAATDEPLLIDTYHEMQRQRRLHGAKAKSRFVVRMETPSEAERAGPAEEIEREWKAQFPPDPQLVLHPESRNKYGSVSALTMSACGRLLAAGSEKGLVSLWLMRASSTLLRSTMTECEGVVEQLAFGHDSMKLAVLARQPDDGFVSVEIYSLNHADVTQPLSKKGEYIVRPMVRLAVVTNQDLRRPTRGGVLPELGQHKELAASLMPRAVWWHPSWSMLGTSGSFLLGLEDGSLVKCNSLDQVQAAPLARFGLASKPYPQAGGARIQNEFFQGHTEPVVFVGAQLTEDLIPVIVSADIAGLILQWRYEPDSFTGFGSFGPASKTRLNMAAAVQGSAAQITCAALGKGARDLVFCLLKGIEPDNNNLGELCSISLHPGSFGHPLQNKEQVNINPGEPLSMCLSSVNGTDKIFLACYSSIQIFSISCNKLHTISPPWLLGPPMPMMGNKTISLAASSGGVVAIATHFSDQVYLITSEAL
eukprot:TRINITY_DN8574_c0_g1_i1.p1 TRINITY_DN8574_c0_g1~~TRINITY_DN8574_c0_g1_i1.p1  ORF type:complete len:595 (-),score=141.53 TRINITY_DN8574_c0_g1_i1:371-2155(-)